jgi:hypothetical protein
MHVDLNLFGSLSMYWISAKSQCTLIVTPYDSRTVKMDTKLCKEVLKTKCLNDIVDYSFVLDIGPQPSFGETLVSFGGFCPLLDFNTLVEVGAPKWS